MSESASPPLSTQTCRRCFLPLSECKHSRGWPEAVGPDSQPSAGQVAVNTSKRSRRCRKCPGNPLRSQCEHTKDGRLYMKENLNEINSRQQASQASNEDEVPTACQPNGQHPLVEQPNGQLTALDQRICQQTVSHQPTGQHPVLNQPNVQQTVFDQPGQHPAFDQPNGRSPSIEPPTTRPPSSEFTEGQPSTSLSLASGFDNQSLPTNRSRNGSLPSNLRAMTLDHHQPSASSSNISHSTSNSTSASFLTQTQHPAPEPTHVLPSQTPNHTMSVNSYEAPMQNDPETLNSAAIDLSSQDNQDNGNGRGKKPPEMKHGSVPAKRGSKDHRIIRRHKRPPPLEDGKAASKRFLEAMNRLCEKADDAAAQTSAWIFVAGQHLSAVGPFIHYTSPRLAREAPEKMNGIINQLSELMTELVCTRRTDSLALITKLKESEKEKGALKEKLAKMDEEMRRMEMEMERMLGEARRRNGNGKDAGRVSANAGPH